MFLRMEMNLSGRFKWKQARDPPEQNTMTLTSMNVWLPHFYPTPTVDLVLADCAFGCNDFHTWPHPKHFNAKCSSSRVDEGRTATLELCPQWSDGFYLLRRTASEAQQRLVSQVTLQPCRATKKSPTRDFLSRVCNTLYCIPGSERRASGSGRKREKKKEYCMLYERWSAFNM